MAAHNGGNFGVYAYRRKLPPGGVGLPDYTREEDDPKFGPLIKTYRILTPVPIATNGPWTVIDPNTIATPLANLNNLPFAPAAMQILNYSEQGVKMSYKNSDIYDVLNSFDVECPSRYYIADAIDPTENDPTKIVIALSGFPSPKPRLIVLRFFSRADITYSVGQLPSDTGPNAMETYEKSTTQATDLTPGGVLASGATDSYQLVHAADTVVVSAEASNMQFAVGSDSSHITDVFTVFAGESRAIGFRTGYIQVKNIGAVDGGYRIWSVYTNESL